MTSPTTDWSASTGFADVEVAGGSRRLAGHDVGHWPPVEAPAAVTAAIASVAAPRTGAV